MLFLFSFLISRGLFPNGQAKVTGNIGMMANEEVFFFYEVIKPKSVIRDGVSTISNDLDGRFCRTGFRFSFTDSCLLGGSAP